MVEFLSFGDDDELSKKSNQQPHQESRRPIMGSLSQGAPIDDWGQSIIVE